MAKSIVKEGAVSVTVYNEVGTIAKMMSFLVDNEINVEAIAGYSNKIGDQGELIFITNNNSMAIKKLLNNGYENVSLKNIIIVQ